jgi:hypothetical protein
VDEYDPLIAPDPAQWLALEEGERERLVAAYHKQNPPSGQNPYVHCAFHVIVENQVAEGDAIPVAAKLRQLMAQGLDRHDAIHAIGSVLIEHLQRVAEGRVVAGDVNRPYYSKLRRLNAKDWLRRR